MKFNRLKFNRLFLAAALAASICLGTAAPVMAQTPGLYSPANIQSGGTIVVAPNSTNVFWTYTLTNGVQSGVIVTNTYNLPVSNSVAGNTNLMLVSIPEYDYIGITWSYMLGTNATCLAYKSFDNGATYEQVPTINFAGPATTVSAYGTNAAIDVHGATTLAFVIKNASNIALTNHLTEVNLKANRFWKMEAGIGQGTVPGTPIHVTGFN